MPWTVRLQDEREKPVVHDDIELPFRMLERLPDNSLLNGIGRYEDTTFNSTQLVLFLNEWQMLKPFLIQAEDLITWTQVASYAKQALDHPHLYLKFIGD